MNAEQSLEWELAGETEVLRENLPHCHFVHHKSYMIWPGIEPGPPTTKRLSYDTVLPVIPSSISFPDTLSSHSVYFHAGSAGSSSLLYRTRLYHGIFRFLQFVPDLNVCNPQLVPTIRCHLPPFFSSGLLLRSRPLPFNIVPIHEMYAL
jgi:hypothetical protein